MAGHKSACNGRCDNLEQFNITMAFQPVVDVIAQDIYAYEALVRGTNGEGAGEILAAVTDENRYAFDQSCRVKAIELAAKLGMRQRLNINFMPNAVYSPQACLQKTLQAAKQHCFPAEHITFEFTEDEQIMDHAHIIDIVRTYRMHGFSTAIDDFGAGYAGLSILYDFDADFIKIDRKIVQGIHDNKNRQAIMQGVLKTAELLGTHVVCEGVETQDEYKYLQASGVRYMQGYLFARPQIETLTGRVDIQWP
jgi:EAL domain-containing protein (putative c-di-GMP-specific phosphodiesterase class I)